MPENASPPATLAVRRDRVPLGIVYMVGATVVFAVTTAITKWQVATYPIGEVIWVRSVVALIVCAALILPQTGLGVFRTARLGDHIKRGFSQSLSQTFILVALSLMPLAGAIAINFSAPLFATLLSVLWLREPVSRQRWTALAVGFLGVLIVTNPGVNTFQIGAAFALANAVLYGTVTVAVRRMAQSESPQTLTMYQMVVISCFTALLLPFGFEMPTRFDAGLMVASGVGNALGQFWWTKALHLAPTSAVTPFSYLSLVWAMILGFIIWGDVPTIGLLIGSVIVVGSGIFLLWHETR
ncbi:MAG: DMT family transporter [Rhizobiales bacterium]|nr:DMT family transporter [Hyphomicrobiales bacterium]